MTLTTVLSQPSELVWTTWSRPFQEKVAAETAQYFLRASPSPRLTFALGMLVLEVAWDDDQYVASEELTGLFGEGDTVDEALRDLIRSMSDLWRELMARRESLGHHMEQQLSTLSAAFLG